MRESGIAVVVWFNPANNMLKTESVGWIRQQDTYLLMTNNSTETDCEYTVIPGEHVYSINMLKPVKKVQSIKK